MGRLKPDRDCFDYVIGKLNCDSSAILFLDDNELNVVAAQKAGIHACKVKGLEEVERLLTQAGILTPPGK